MDVKAKHQCLRKGCQKLAEEDTIDIYGHQIKKESEYVTGHYLEKVYQSKKEGKVFYKQLKKTVYVYPAEIFCPAVPVDKDQLFLTNQEYQFLCDSI